MAKRFPYTSKTLAYLEKSGFQTGIVERFIGQAGKFGVRKDLFGIFDLISYDVDCTIGIQTTSRAQLAPHHRTIMESEHTFGWLNGPGRKIYLITWSKKKVKRGGIAFKYVPHIREYMINVFGKLTFEDSEEL